MGALAVTTAPAGAMTVDGPPVHRAASPPTVRHATGPTLGVDAKAGKHRISPDIYGINFADESFADAIDLPVDRWGGDTTETYNWQIRGANNGINWYFENFPDCWEETFDYCTTGHDYSAADALIEKDRRVGAKTVLNLPALGWVAKSVSYDQDQLCSYPGSVFDPQDDHDPYRDPALMDSCGSGRRNGHWISSPAVDPTVAGKQVGPDFAGSWVDDLTSRYGQASQGGVRIYELGNEPGLWNETHRDFHPAPLSYDELGSKSLALAQAVKDADPGAQVLGPAEWGWPNYFCSTADVPDNGCTPSSPDRHAHGGLDISSWYLRQFAKHEQQTGDRLLDYFDLHYYPQGSYNPVADVTRPLWDTGYRDPSWIGEKIYLLPRMRAWVRANYPGTKLAMTEYNFGLDVTSDVRLQNVIQADALGIFGREGLDLATFWGQDGAAVPEGAFRIFRNYDGRHHGFGDRGVKAVSAAQGKVSVYAARRGAGGPLTIVVVNKTAGSLRSPLVLKNFPHAATATAYRYAGGDIVRLAPLSTGRGGFTLTYPPRSVTLVALKPS